MAENGIQAHACETMNNTLPDGAILDAWERRKAAWARWSALPDSPVAHATAEEAECTAIVDAAEIAICNEIATTPAGIAIQLWISIDYSADAQASGMADAIHREDTDVAIKKLEQLHDLGKITDKTFQDLATTYANLGVETANAKIYQDAESC